MAFEVLISLSSFGAAEVGRHGGGFAVTGATEGLEVRDHALRRGRAVVGQIAQYAEHVVERGIIRLEPGQQCGETTQRLHHVVGVAFGVRQIRHCRRTPGSVISLSFSSPHHVPRPDFAHM